MNMEMLQTPNHKVKLNMKLMFVKSVQTQQSNVSGIEFNYKMDFGEKITIQMK